MAKKRFTFRKEPKETGLRAVGHTEQSVTIKLGGWEVGRIRAPSWRDKGWLVGLMINQREHENCSWSWWFPQTFATEQEARAWLNGADFQSPKCGLRVVDDATE